MIREDFLSRTYQTKAGKRGKSKTGGTGFGVWGALTRAMALDKDIDFDMEDAGGEKSILNDPSIAEKIFKNYGINPLDHLDLYRTAVDETRKSNEEARSQGLQGSDKAWRLYRNKYVEEYAANWKMVYEKSLKNPKLKAALIASFRKSLDVAYGGSAVLIASHWEEETGLIKTYSNLGPELEEVFALQDDEFDLVIGVDGKNITIELNHSGPTRLNFWSGKLSWTDTGSAGFPGISGDEKTFGTTFNVDFNSGKFRTKLDETEADIQNRRIQAYYSIERYVKQKGWVSDTERPSSGVIPLLSDVKKVLPSVTKKIYDLLPKNGRVEEMIEVVAGLSVLDPTPSSPEQVFRPYEKILNDYAKAKNSGEVPTEYQTSRGAPKKADKSKTPSAPKEPKAKDDPRWAAFEKDKSDRIDDLGDKQKKEFEKDKKRMTFADFLDKHAVPAKGVGRYTP